jgi:hypothetical protein
VGTSDKSPQRVYIYGKLISSAAVSDLPKGSLKLAVSVKVEAIQYEVRSKGWSGKRIQMAT